MLRTQFVAECLERRVLLSSTTPATPLPLNGAPQGVPGTVEFENHDSGGEGVSFHNPAGAGITLGPASDAGGGQYVGSTMPGEWINYTVNVAATTLYTLNLRVASGSAGGTIHINLDGNNATGPIRIAGTGGWQNWTTISVPNVSIPAGQHVLALVIDAAATPGSSSIANFNWMQLRDDPATSPRTQWWRDARFGMFIHWGLYSQLAGHWNGQTTSGAGEWIMNDLHIPLDQYAQVARQFDPTQFNADQWVRVAKAAGMKYIVITSKHHDGFSMFNTSVNNYNVVAATPWHQDPLAQLSTAARAAGLHFGVYYSILNWADPNASDAGIDTYMRTMETQLRELISTDHPEILWFDGNWPTWWTAERSRELEAYVRNLDPAVIINSRIAALNTSGGGDYDTPEQTIPTTEPAGRLWETSMTINDTWGYKDTDANFKSAATILQDLQAIESRGGNYLLNVGPTGAGVIPAPEVQILQQVGQALGVNTGTGTGTGTGTSGGGTGSGGSGGSGGTTTGGGTGDTPTGGGSTTTGGGGTTTTPPPTTGAGVPARTLDFSARQKATFIDAAGNRVTVTLRGTGTGQLSFDSTGNADLAGLVLSGTDGHSVVAIRGNTAIGDVAIDGALGGLAAPTADLTGSLAAQGAVRSIQLRSATGGQMISAPFIGSIALRANLADEVQADTIGRITIGGVLVNAAIRAASSIGSLVAAAAQNSEIFAGVRSDLTALPASSADFTNAGSSIGSVTIRGRGTFSDTQVAAVTIATASVGTIHPANAGTPFGVAAHQIKTLRATYAGRPHVFHNLAVTTPLDGDAIARIV